MTACGHMHLAMKFIAIWRTKDFSVWGGKCIPAFASFEVHVSKSWGGMLSGNREGNQSLLLDFDIWLIFQRINHSVRMPFCNGANSFK